MAEALDEIWCVYFQKDGQGQNMEDEAKPKRLYLFDNTDGAKWHCIDETDPEDMKAMIGHLANADTHFAMMIIPKSACTTDENGLLSGVTFPSEFTGIAGS
jgi:hypothetical protein